MTLPAQLMDWGMSEPTKDYLDSVAELKRAVKNASDVVGIVVAVGRALQKDPLNFAFTNLNVPLPPGVGGKEGASADAAKWPTAEQIQQALAGWHAARELARRAWNDVPDVRRRSLTPPPD